MTMNGDPRTPESQSASGTPADGAPRTDARADLGEDLRADLAAVGAAWSALEQEQPPDQLDRSVLSTARRAVAEPGPPPRRPLRWPFAWPFGWPGAFATAAALVLALTVVLEQDREAPVSPPPAIDGFELERSKAAPKLEAADQDATQTESSEARSARQPVPAAAADMEQDLPEPEREAHPAGPEDWIERLRELKARGDSAAFERELVEFRAAYPAYALPPELLE